MNIKNMTITELKKESKYLQGCCEGIIEPSFTIEDNKRLNSIKEELLKRNTCRGCEQEFSAEEINDEGFCCEECEWIYDNPRSLKD